MVGFKNGFSKISVGIAGQVPDAAEAAPSTKPEIPQVIRCGRLQTFQELLGVEVISADDPGSKLQQISGSQINMNIVGLGCRLSGGPWSALDILNLIYLDACKKSKKGRGMKSRCLRFEVPIVGFWSR